MRAIREAFRQIGLKGDLLKHGLFREVYLCPLAANASAVLAGREAIPDYNGLLSVEEVSRLACERWVVPRAQRQPGFSAWRRDELRELLRSNVNPVCHLAAAG